MTLSAPPEADDVERPDRSSRPRFRRRIPPVAVSALVGLVGALVAWELRTVPVPTDPWHYVEAGLTFPDASWNTVGLTRYGMILPMMLVTRLFGMSEMAFYLPPVLASGVLVGALHWLGVRFFGQVAAVAGVVVVMANSVVLIDASRAYPDVFAVAMTAVAVALAVAARDRWRRDERVRSRLVLLLAGVGAFVGLSWWMRETAVFAWPVVAAVLLWRGGPPWRVVLPVAGGVAAGFLAVEMLIGQLAFGDPMVRFEALSGADLSQTTNAADLPYLNQGRLDYLAVIPRTALLFADGHVMIVLAVLAVLGGVLAPRRVGLFAGWFLLVALAFVAIGGALRPGSPNIRLDVSRYWVAFLPPMAMAATGAVAALVARLGPRVASGWAGRTRALAAVGIACLLTAVPVLTSATEVRRQPTFVVVNHDTMSPFRNWLAAHDRGVDRIFAERDTERILDVYTRSLTGRPMSHVRFRSLNGHLTIRPGDHVVVFSAHDQTCTFCNANVNAWLDEHPGILDRWKRVWTSPDRRFEVYRVPRSAGRERLAG